MPTPGPVSAVAAVVFAGSACWWGPCLLPQAQKDADVLSSTEKAVLEAREEALPLAAVPLKQQLVVELEQVLDAADRSKVVEIPDVVDSSKVVELPQGKPENLSSSMGEDTKDAAAAACEGRTESLEVNVSADTPAPVDGTTDGKVPAQGADSRDEPTEELLRWQHPSELFMAIAVLEMLVGTLIFKYCRGWRGPRAATGSQEVQSSPTLLASTHVQQESAEQKPAPVKHDLAQDDGDQAATEAPGSPSQASPVSEAHEHAGQAPQFVPLFDDSAAASGTEPLSSPPLPEAQAQPEAAEENPSLPSQCSLVIEGHEELVEAPKLAPLSTDSLDDTGAEQLNTPLLPDEHDECRQEVLDNAEVEEPAVDDDVAVAMEGTVDEEVPAASATADVASEAEVHETSAGVAEANLAGSLLEAPVASEGASAATEAPQAAEEGASGSATEIAAPAPQPTEAPALQQEGIPTEVIKLKGRSERALLDDGLQRLHDLLGVTPAGCCPSSLPRRANGTSKLLRLSFFERLLRDEVQFRSLMATDVSAAQGDIKHLSLQQLLLIRVRSLDFTAENRTHEAHANFNTTVERFVFEQLARHALRDYAPMSAPVSPTAAAATDRMLQRLGQMLVLLIGARLALEAKQAKKSGPDPPMFWLAALIGDEWPGFQAVSAQY